MTGKDYHCDACSITGKECDGLVCSSCDTAIQHEKGESEAKQESLTIFDSEANFKGIKLKSNRIHTIALIENEEQLKNITELNKDVLSTTPRNYNDVILASFPEYGVLKKALGLGIPTQILADINKIGIFKYGAVIYLIAPTLDAE